MKVLMVSFNSKVIAENTDPNNKPSPVFLAQRIRIQGFQSMERGHKVPRERDEPLRNIASDKVGDIVHR